MILDGKAIHPLVDAMRGTDPEVADLLTASLLTRVREALLRGDVVTLPGVGRLSVRDRRRYGVTNPHSGQTTIMGGEKAVMFQPDRLLLRDLNTTEDVSHER